MSTDVSPLLDASPSRRAARSPAAAPPAAGGAAREPRSRWAPVALAALVAVAAVTVTLVLLRPAPPVRIAVLRPAVAAGADAANADDNELQLVRSGVLVTVLGGLAARQGLAPVELSEPRRNAEPPVETAQAAAAAEVLSATIERVPGARARIALRRIRGSDGAIVATRTFDVLTDPGELRPLADAVELNLARLYPEHPRRAGTPELEVRDEDYAAFLDVKRRLLSGNAPLPPELQQLERIARSSPRFLDSHLLGASLARSLFQSTLDRRYLEREIEHVRQAERLAPNDPRVAVEQFRLALARDHDDEAEATLGRIGELLPGDPRCLEFRAELHESRGQMDEAIADMSAAVEHAPSWQYLFRLANLELQGGRTADARRHFETLLTRDPRNLWGLEGLANMELLAGDPQRAERLYRRLIGITPQRSYFTNLGQTYFLLARYEEAERAYRQALALAPDHFSAKFNLAEAKLALGQRAEALALFRQVLEQVEAHEAISRLDANDSMLAAQCLAYLGRTREAVEVTLRTLQRYPADTEVLYLAAVVYALVGEPTSALVHAGNALDKGCQPRWFTIPAFDSLRDNPEFRALLAGKTGTRPG
jgi:serine/threonine-protein kinase